MLQGVALALALAIAMTASSCRGVLSPSAATQQNDRIPTSTSTPVNDLTSRSHLSVTPEDEEHLQVPVATRITSVTDTHGLHLKLDIVPERRGDHPFYAPRTPGGWAFQTFLNVDQNPFTGYSHGYEFLTRDSEADLEPGTLVLRRTQGGGGPGGWGDEVARIPVHISPRLVMFTIPLDAIEDDGVVDFRIEFYAIVLGGADGMTPVAHYFRLYDGSSDLRHELRTSRSLLSAAAAPRGSS